MDNPLLEQRIKKRAIELLNRYCSLSTVTALSIPGTFYQHFIRPHACAFFQFRYILSTFLRIGSSIRKNKQCSLHYRGIALFSNTVSSFLCVNFSPLKQTLILRFQPFQQILPASVEDRQALPGGSKSLFSW